LFGRALSVRDLRGCAGADAYAEPPVQPATQDAKQAERERKEREKQEAKAAKEKAKQDAKAAKEAEKAAQSQATGEKVAMSGSAEQELKQLTDQSIAALKGKDATALERIWADELIFTNPRGDVQTKAQRLADIQSGATRFDSLETRDLAVRVYGDTAVMNGLTTVKGQYSGQETSGQYRVTQVLVRRGGRWQIVALQMTPIATTTPAEKKP
jgi:ketosteroid isomerase-like protein